MALRWDNAGVEPTEQKKTDGFIVNEKAPAAYFNWLFNQIIGNFINFINKVSDKASQAQAEAGTDDATYMTPLKAKQAMVAKLGYKYTIVFGDYTGDLQATRDINIGFTPQILLVTQLGRMWYVSPTYSWLMGGLVTPTNSYAGVLEIITNGFRVAYNGSDARQEKTNAQYGTYSYIAIKKEAIV